MEKVYETAVTANTGRNGRIKSSDGLLDLEVRFPKEMGGTGGATNPEQLFAAAWSACFGTSINVAANLENVKIGNVQVMAKIGIIHSNGSYDLEANLIITIENVDQPTANMLTEKAKSICSFSKATNGNIATTYLVN